MHTILYSFFLGLFLCFSTVGAAKQHPGLQKAIPAKKTSPSTHQTYAPFPAQQLFKTKKREVRVLLAQYNAADIHHFTFCHSQQQQITLESPHNSGIYRQTPSPELHVVCKEGELFLPVSNNKGAFRKLKYPDLVLSTNQGFLSLGNHCYQGTIRVVIDRPTKKLLIINTLGLEDYVGSVLASESLAHWPLEMQMVQAITSRTYALFLLAHNHLHNSLHHYFDIKNNNSHQIYQGHHNIKRLHEAVQATAGIVVTHQQNLALTMFDACCGGVIPAHIKRSEVSKPYLARTKQCTYCKESYLFSWSKRILAQELVDALAEHPRHQNSIRNLGILRSVQVTKKDKAGIAQQISLQGSKHTVHISGHDMRNCFAQDIKSNCIQVSMDKQKQIHITGKGFGHQLGLCQCGARAMVREGKTYAQILAFYFPGTQLSILQ